MKKKLAWLLSLLFLLSACGNPGQSAQQGSDSVVSTAATDSAQENITTEITLSDDGIQVIGTGATAQGNTLTISEGGQYTLTGTLSDGQLLVDAEDQDVTLVFSGITISSSEGAPVYVKKAASVCIELSDGSENTISDSDSYILESGEDEPDAAIFSKADLLFSGSGKLTVTGNYSMAIHSKDTLTLQGSGCYTISALLDGIKGKDSVEISGPVSLTIDAGEDGIQASNSKDSTLGTISISDGTLNITAGKHGIKAETSLDLSGGQIIIDAQSDGLHAGTSATISGSTLSLDIEAQEDGIQAGSLLDISSGTLSITTGGGAENAPEHTEDFGFPGWFDTSTEEDTPSAKGLKSDGDMTISGGTITLDCMDDSLHCAGTLSIMDPAKLTISSGDDGIHSDDVLDISGGIIQVTDSYEGLEAVFITISGGEIDLVASDDGLNAAGGSTADTDFDFMGPGNGSYEALEDASYYIHITGGSLNVDAGGDGLDSNGALYMDGGTVVVSGPEDSMNGALDYTTTGQITGGTLIACGASGMAENFDSSSTQCALRYNLDSTIAAGATVTLADADGNILLETTLAKSFSSVVISTPEMQVGQTYTLTCGDTSVEVTLTDTITAQGSDGFGGNPGDFGPGGPGGGPGNFGGGPGM